MGYNAPDQVTAGIHMRQFARAFIIEDNSNRIVFVNVDCHSIDQIIKLEVKYIVLFFLLLSGAIYTHLDGNFLLNW